MRGLFSFFLVSILASVSWAGEPLLCSGTYESVCHASDPKREQRKKQVSAIRARIEKASLLKTLDPVSQGGCGIQIDWDIHAGFEKEDIAAFLITESGKQNLFNCFMRIYEKEALKVLAPRGITLPVVRAYFERIKREMVYAIGDQSPMDPLLRERMKDEVRSVTLFTASNFGDLSKIQSRADFVQEFCGLRLENNNAYASHSFLYVTREKDPESGAPIKSWIKEHGVRPVVLCPAKLLDLLTYDTQDPLLPITHVLAHEIGHHIHAVKNWDYQPFSKEEEAKWYSRAEKTWKTKKVIHHYSYLDPKGRALDPQAWEVNYVPAYGDFGSCLKDRYSDQLKDGPMREFYESIIAEALGKDPKDVDAVEMHYAETSADLWGTEALWRTLRKSKNRGEDVAWALRSNMGRLCDMVQASAARPNWLDDLLEDEQKKEEKKVAPEDRDSGTHPSVRFRVEMVLRHPQIRAALGCSQASAANPARPFCAISGEVR